ncbi:MAG: TIGR04255 family protein [Jatrophihabitantaceae bacterium]
MAATELSFRNPPINEVVAGVTFAALGADGIALLSGFWRDLARDTFPEFQVQPPYTTTIEQFNVNPSVPDLPGGLQFIAGYRAPRFWAVGDKGQYLLQLQPDWFACNWRRVRVDDEYYRWAQRREDFESWYRKLDHYIFENSGQNLTPLSCEVTYINHITPTATFQAHSDYAKVFVATFGDLGLIRENFSSALRYLVPSPGGDGPSARLHVQIDAALDGRGQQIYVLQLTARGSPQDNSVEGVMSFLEHARKVINDSFIALTTADMQHDWGRTDV